MTQTNKCNPRSPREAAACCMPIDGLLEPELFKALSDPTRTNILACIAKCGRGCSVTEIAGCCTVDLSVVSRHLAILERAGLLDSVKDGRTVYYQVRYSFLAGRLREIAAALEGCCPQNSMQI